MLQASNQPSYDGEGRGGSFLRFLTPRPFSPSFIPSPLLPRTKPPEILQERLGIDLSSPSGVRAEPKPKSNLMHFSLKIWHLVATILMTSWESTDQISCSLRC